MMINKLIDEMIDIINADDYFSNIKVVKAYPFKTKPSRITKAYLALGINEINMQPSQLDSSDRAGEISVFADIFVPLDSDSEYVSEIFSRLCNAMKFYNVLSVSASRIMVDSAIQARVLKTVITFNDEICFGGDACEQ